MIWKDSFLQVTFDSNLIANCRASSTLLSILLRSPVRTVLYCFIAFFTITRVLSISFTIAGNIPARTLSLQKTLPFGEM